MTPEQLIKGFEGLRRPKIYEKWAEIRRNLIIHTRGLNPGKMLLKRHPHEDEQAYRWRLDNYAPITTPIIINGLRNINRIFQNTGWNTSGESDDLLAYLASKNFGDSEHERTDFWNFIQTQCLTAMVEDPNGVLAWIPAEASEYDSIDVSKQLQPVPVIVPSSEIWHFTRNLICFRSNEGGVYYDDVAKDFGVNNSKRAGVYYIITPTTFQKFVPYEFGGIKQSQSLVYEHNIGTLPVTVFGGEWANEGYYNSFCNGYQAFANELLMIYSDLQAIISKFAYPIREVAHIKCTQEGCVGGRIWNETEHVFRNCGTCNGTGAIALSPFKDIIRPEITPNIDQVDNRPMIQFHSPDSSILEFAYKNYESTLEKVQMSLYIKYIDEAQSGVAKNIDREQMYSWLAAISTRMYDVLMYNSLNFIEAYRVVNPSQRAVITVQKPINFQIKTESELQKQMSEMVLMGATQNFVLSTAKDFADFNYGGNPVEIKKTDFLIRYDVLYGLTNEAIVFNQSAGLIDNTTMIKHLHSPRLLLLLIDEVTPSEFLKMDYNQVSMAIDKMVQPIVDSLPKTVPLM